MVRKVKPRSGRPDGRAEAGFVLLVVLAALGLLALVAASFVEAARSHMRLAAVAREGAAAEALADAGVQMAILDLVAARENRRASRRFEPDATPLTCGVDDAVLTITVLDEAGKVDINIASPALLRALVFGVGVSGGEAAVDAILDYRDDDDDRRISGAERSEYIQAGKPSGPRNGAFLAVEELANVLGITPSDVDLLLPFVTIHSGLTAIDMNVASQALVDVLARGYRSGATDSLIDSAFATSGLSTMDGRSGALPPSLLAASTRRAFAVRAQAQTAAGATFVREAIVDFISPNSTAFLVRRWHRGSASAPNPLATRALPPC